MNDGNATTHHESDAHVHHAYFVLGSNVDPERNLRAAVPLLAEFGRVVSASPVYESPAIGVGEQPPYLNGALVLETEVDAATLFTEVVPFVERQIGERPRAARLGERPPRRIDVDLVLFDDVTGRVAEHLLPAPDVLERAYVAVPLADIAPDLEHPTTGRTLREIAAEFDATKLAPRPDVNLQPTPFEPEPVAVSPIDERIRR